MGHLPVLRALALGSLLLLPAGAAARAQEAGASPVPETAPEAEQAAPLVIHYQGRFGDPGGVPLPGPVDLTFRIYGAATGGSALWSETHQDVPLNEGVASVLLGSLVAFPSDLFTVATRYLGIAVEGGAELTPRMRLASVPYALEAERLGGKAASDFEPKGTVLGLSVTDGNPPNQGSNRVHWNNLTGVPTGLADGEDDGFEDHGLLTGLLDDDHPQYALRSDLGETGGTGPNVGKNLVHWENLVGVPSGFADGADNTGSGGATDHGDLEGLEDDDHPQYALDADLAAHGAASDPHPGYSLDTDLAAHAAQADAHHAKTVDAGELATGVLDPARLPLEGITGANILDGSVGAADLQPGILDTILLSPGSVDSAEIAPGAVRSIHLAAGAVGNAQIAGGAVTTDRVLDGSLTGADIADGSLGALDTADEAGFEENVDLNEVILDGNPTTLITATIDCPSSGWVLATATGQACLTPPPVAGTYAVTMSIGTQENSHDDETLAVVRGFVGLGAYHCGSLVSQKVFPVSAGSAVFHLVADGPEAGNGTLERPRITLVFLPTRY